MKKLSNLALTACFALCGTMTAWSQAQTVYGYQMGDALFKFGFVKFTSTAITDLEVTQSTGDDKTISAGEYVDGKYYAFNAFYDSFFEGGVVTGDYTIYNVNANGQYEEDTTFEIYGEKRVVDMTFDYTTNTMYAIAESKKDDSGRIGTTELYIVDMPTGKLYLVGGPGDITAQDGYGRTVHEDIMTVAASPDGQLYGMGAYRQLYKLDKYTGLATAVGTRHKIAVINDFQSMTFSPDGKLYHAQCHPDYEYFMLIDPATAELTNPVTNEPVTVDASFNNNAARFTNDPQITGIYFKGKTVNAAANLAPTELKAELKSGTSNTVELSWTLPTKAYGGAAASVTGVLVYRLGEKEPIATLGATATTYTDESAPDGDVIYYVTTTSAAGQGFPALATAMAGADQLKAVGDLKLVQDGANITLSWTAPTETVNGGYADFANITYQVIAMQGTTSTEIADAQKETTCTYTLPKPGTYYFIVTPISAGVGGLPAQTQEVTLEQSSSIPYFTGFEDDQDGTLWTVINPIGGNYGWSIENPAYDYMRYDGKCAKFATGSSTTYPADSWLVSPGIEMEPGIYSFKFVAAGGVSTDKYSFEVGVGTDATNGGSFNVLESYLEQIVYNNEDGNISHFLPFETSFTIEEAGTYYLGFHGIGCGSYTTVRIDNVEVDKTADLPSAGLALPYATSFEPEEENQWTYLNNDIVPNAGWSILKQSSSSKSYDGDYYARFYTQGAATLPMNAWFISPALDFEEGEYELSLAINGTSYDTHTFNIALGTNANDDESFTQILKSYEEAELYSGVYAEPYVIEKINFTVEKAGTYFIGIQGIGNAGYASLMIDDLKVEKADEAPEIEALTLPYAHSFEPEEENQWTYLNNDQVANAGWSIGKKTPAIQAYEGDCFAQFKTQGMSTLPMDAWMISPALNIPAGEYELVFAVEGSSYNTQTFRVTLGTDASDKESFTQELRSYEAASLYDRDVDHHYVIETIPVKIDNDGIYHIGLHGIGDMDYGTLKIDALQLTAKETTIIDSIINDATGEDADAPAVYYDLTGRRITNPAPGHIYIVRKGNTVTKQLVR